MRFLPLLIISFYSLSFAQVTPLQRAPTSPTSDQGTGPTLGGAMGGAGTQTPQTGADSSLYGPSRGNEFPQERMESPGVIESFDDEPSTSPGTSGTRRDLPPGQVIPGVSNP